MNLLPKIALVLVVILVSLSAYLRLAHSGIGCADWPVCYGRVGAAPAVSQVVDSGDAYRRMAEQADEPMAWATPVHRLVAGVLGLLILIMFLSALRKKRHRLISLALLGLTVFLSALGIWSGDLIIPAVVMGNLAGGFFMLGLLGWMVFNPGDPAEGAAENRLVARWTILAIVVLSLQVLLGGLTSANFGATACQTLPDCQGSWLPGSGLITALDLSREHVVNDQGIVVGGAEMAAIHKTHRLGALLAVTILLATSVAAFRAAGRFRNVAIIIMVLVAVEFSVGIAAILTGLPIGLAVAHNGLAALLLLGLLKLLSLARVVTQSPDDEGGAHL